MTHEIEKYDDEAFLNATASRPTLIKFKEGHWWQSDKEVAKGTAFLLYPKQLLRGVIKFEGHQLVGQRIGKFGTEAFNEDPDQADGWLPYTVMPMKNAETGELVAYSATSWSGRRAANRICNQAVSAYRNGKGAEFPMILIDAGAEFNKQKGGDMPVPTFELVDLKDETPTLDFSTNGKSKPDMDDEIPF